MQLREFELRFRLSRYKSLGRGASTADSLVLSFHTRKHTKAYSLKSVHEIANWALEQTRFEEKDKEGTEKFWAASEYGGKKKERGFDLSGISFQADTERADMEEDSVDLYSVCLLQERSSSR